MLQQELTGVIPGPENRREFLRCDSLCECGYWRFNYSPSKSRSDRLSTYAIFFLQNKCFFLLYEALKLH